MDEANYRSEKLGRISDADHVRKLPHLYLGEIDLSDSANCLARESLCLAIDQLVADTCSHVEIAIQPNGRFSVAHKGVPLGIERLEKYDDRTECEMIAAALAFSQMSANWELGDREFAYEDVCKISLPVVNFLSEFFRIDNYHESGHYAVEFAFGKTTDDLKRIGDSERSGVSIEYRLDHSILGETALDFAALRQWFSELPMDINHARVVWNDFR